ncbi:MAG: hypothetical protein GY906_32410 [bacterium]|nr:hypothetical protein [bacterium]
MIQFRLFGFPVRAEFWILVTAVFIGPRSEGLPRLLMWIASVLVGILIHELGHAFAARSYGLQPSIALHAFGGTTSWAAPVQLRRGPRAVVTAAGPAIGISVGLLLLLIRVAFGVPSSELIGALLAYLVWVNLGWGLLNLLPIFPLDGGQLVMVGAEAAAGARGRVLALGLSLFVLAAAAVWAILTRNLWLILMCGLLGWSNIAQFRLIQRGPTSASETPTEL